MKKSRPIPGCMAVVILALFLSFAFAGCTMPDYQLDTAVSASVSGTTATIQYTFTNVGSRDLKNVHVFVVVQAYYAGGTYATNEIDLGPFAISTYGSASGASYVYFLPAYSYTGAEASITSIGWDESSNSSWN